MVIFLLVLVGCLTLSVVLFRKDLSGILTSGRYDLSRVVKGADPLIVKICGSKDRNDCVSLPCPLICTVIDAEEEMISFKYRSAACFNTGKVGKTIPLRKSGTDYK